MLSDLARQQQAGFNQIALAQQRQQMGVSPWTMGLGGGAAQVMPGAFLGGVFAPSTIEKMQMDVDEWLKDWED